MSSRRWLSGRPLRLVSTAVLAWSVASMPALAQEEIAPDPIQVLADALSKPGETEVTARIIRHPTSDEVALSDAVGDLEHPSGEEPGFTPDHLDITDTWALRLEGAPLNIFTSPEVRAIWAPTGRRQIDPPGHEPFQTVAGDRQHDGSQFGGGAIIFGMSLVETPPITSPGRCEYVVWVHDRSRGETFLENPGLPLDPADGTNLAFGLALEPSDDPEMHFAFAIELRGEGFARLTRADVRGLITPRHIGIIVPDDLIGDLAGVNYYAFCSEEGNEFDPASSGGDQLGIVEMTDAELGIIEFSSHEIDIETTTTSVAQSSTTGQGAAPTAEDGTSGDQPSSWWPALVGGGAGLALLGWWFFRRRTDPCAELLDAWVSARRAGADARHRAEEAARACDLAEITLERLTDEHREVCRAWPPACWETAEGDWIEDRQGNRMTARDIHMRKVALGSAWERYKRGELGAGQVEARWRELDTPELRRDIDDADTAFEHVAAGIESELSELERMWREACERAAEAGEAAGRARSAAEETRADYADCVPARADDNEAVATKTRRAGEPETIRILFDFSVTARTSRSVAEESEELDIRLSALMTGHDAMGELLELRSAGLHMGGGGDGYVPGIYTVTSDGVARRAVDAVVGKHSPGPTPPTRPWGEEIDDTTLQVPARLFFDPIRELAEGAEYLDLRMDTWHQRITATPYDVLARDPGGDWSLVERIWEVEVGEPLRVAGMERRYPLVPGVCRRVVLGLVEALIDSMSSEIVRDGAGLVRWRANHEPDRFDPPDRD